MSSRTGATAVVAALIVSLLAGSFGWNAWKTLRMEKIPVGASKAAVLAALGDPDNAGIGVVFAGCGHGEGSECWTWKLIGQNYLSVCFDKAGKVICHKSFSVWT